jgi:hypothetical protein
MRVESIVIEFSDLCTSRPGQAAGKGACARLHHLVGCGVDALLDHRGRDVTASDAGLACHNPGLRDGNSAASAGTAQIRTRIGVAAINRMNSIRGQIAVSGRCRTGSWRIN